SQQCWPNTAVGAHALGSNIDSGGNTAVGYFALGSLTTGFLVGTNTTKGGYSTAVGFEALASAVGSSSTGGGNVNDAFGYQALAKLTSGLDNVGIGTQTLFSNTTGNDNTALGDAAGSNIVLSWNIDIGSFVEGDPTDDHVSRIGQATGT